MRLPRWTLWGRYQATAWKLSEVTERDSIPFVSTGSSVSASLGPTVQGQWTSRSWTITSGKESLSVLRRAVHPGEILKDELTELGVTPTTFARQIDVPPNRVSQIIAGKRSVTGDTALRFGHWLGVDPQFWLNLQAQFDLAAADQRVGAVVRTLPTADRSA